MCTKKNCCSPHASIGEKSASATRPRPTPNDQRRQPATGLPRPRERVRAAVVGERGERDGDGGERIERPARQHRQIVVGAPVSEDHSA